MHTFLKTRAETCATRMHQLDKGALPPYNLPGWPSAKNQVIINHYHGQSGLKAERTPAQEWPHEQGQTYRRDGLMGRAHSGVEADSGVGAHSGGVDSVACGTLWYSNLALAALERSGNLMMEFLIANMPILKNFKTLRPPHGLEEAHVVHRLGPDQFRDVPHPSKPKFDLP